MPDCGRVTGWLPCAGVIDHCTLKGTASSCTAKLAPGGITTRTLLGFQTFTRTSICSSIRNFPEAAGSGLETKEKTNWMAAKTGFE